MPAFFYDWLLSWVCLNSGRWYFQPLWVILMHYSTSPKMTIQMQGILRCNLHVGKNNLVYYLQLHAILNSLLSRNLGTSLCVKCKAFCYQLSYTASKYFAKEILVQWLKLPVSTQLWSWQRQQVLEAWHISFMERE